MTPSTPPPDGSHETPPLKPSATVACLRQRDHGLEVLMVQRHAQLAFHGGAWVFPGGRVELEDAPDGDPQHEHAARVAAIRETMEETSIALSPEHLLALSHWTTPPGRPRRFTTWFYLHALDQTPAVCVDGGEILAHRWLTPQGALNAQQCGELELPPPTFVTLTWLASFERVDHALDAARAQTPTRYVPRLCATAGGTIALYQGDAGYADFDPERAGARHRLSMLEHGWRYEQSP